MALLHGVGDWIHGTEGVGQDLGQVGVVAQDVEHPTPPELLEVRGASPDLTVHIGVREKVPTKK